MTTTNTPIVRIGLTAAGLAAAGLLAACSSSNDTATSTSASPASSAAVGHGDGHGDGHGSHGESAAAPTSVAPQANSADVSFATMMIPHHSQAVDMADLVPSRTDNAWLIAFAERIKEAQQPEINQMTEALKSWGQPVPDAKAEHVMDGMMTPEQMKNLESLKGEAFDREWITMMIAHHRGAVTMAQDELKSGENPEMREMAQSIIDSQQAEIVDMEQQLKK